MQDVRVVAKLQLGQFELAAALDVDHGRAVDQNIGDGIVAQQRLERPKPHHVVDNLDRESVLIMAVQRHSSIARNVGDRIVDAGPQFLRAEPHGDDGLDLHQNFIANGIGDTLLRPNGIDSRPKGTTSISAAAARRGVRLSRAELNHAFLAEIEHDYPNSRLSIDRGGSSTSPTS